MPTTVWRGYVTFGLISIPVRLFRAARAERVPFRRVYREENTSPPRRAEPEPKTSEHHRVHAVSSILRPVQQAAVRNDTDEVVPTSSVVKGFEYEKNRYVAIEPEELKSIAVKTATQIEIQECVNLAEIDPVYFETSYYVSPEEAGEKAYALLYRALQATGLVALAQFAMHNREHVVVLRPGKTGLIAHTMFYASEVRAQEEYRADTSSVTQNELDLAQTLVQSLAAPFEAEKYRDTYRERLESMIASKLAGRPVAATEPRSTAAVVDITDALRKSLANLKKPAQAAQAPRSEPAAQATERKRRSRSR